MARPSPLRRHAAAADSRVRAGPGEMESEGHLSLCRCLWCHGSSPAGHETGLWGSSFVRTFQVALHFRAAVSAGNVCRVLLVGPEGNFASGFLLGRLAWADADLRVLPHLRR